MFNIADVSTFNNDNCGGLMILEVLEILETNFSKDERTKPSSIYSSRGKLIGPFSLFLHLFCVPLRSTN